MTGTDQEPNGGEDEHAARRAIDVVEAVVRSIERIKEVVEKRASALPVDRLDAFSVIWGWSMRIFRTGELVAAACRQGLAAEASPLIRSMSEHAMALVWLSDEGDAARAAVTAARQQHQRHLVMDMRAVGWENSALASFSPPDPPPASTFALEQITDFRLMFGSYDGGVPYAAYRIESANTHPTYDSAAGYFDEVGHETLRIRTTSQRQSSSAALLAAMFVMLGVMVLQRETGDEYLAALMDSGFDLLGSRFALPARVEAAPPKGAGNDAVEATAKRLLRTLRVASEDGAPLAVLAGQSNLLDSMAEGARRELRKVLQRAESRLTNAETAVRNFLD